MLAVRLGCCCRYKSYKHFQRHALPEFDIRWNCGKNAPKIKGPNSSKVKSYIYFGMSFNLLSSFLCRKRMFWKHLNSLTVHKGSLLACTYVPLLSYMNIYFFQLLKNIHVTFFPYINMPFCTNTHGKSVLFCFVLL